MRMFLWLIFLFSVGILALNLPALHSVLDWIFTSFQRPAKAVVVTLSVVLFFLAAGQLAKNRQIVAILSVPVIAFGVFEFFQSEGKVVVAMMALFCSVATIVAQLRSEEPS